MLVLISQVWTRLHALLTLATEAITGSKERCVERKTPRLHAVALLCSLCQDECCDWFKPSALLPCLEILRRKRKNLDKSRNWNGSRKNVNLWYALHWEFQKNSWNFVISFEGSLENSRKNSYLPCNPGVLWRMSRYYKKYQTTDCGSFWFAIVVNVVSITRRFFDDLCPVSINWKGWESRPFFWGHWKSPWYEVGRCCLVNCLCTSQCKPPPPTPGKCGE